MDFNKLSEALAKEGLCISKKGFIQKAIKKPGALRKQLGVKKDEKITLTQINKEIAKIKKKEPPYNKTDLTKLRRLYLAKRLMGMKKK